MDAYFAANAVSSPELQYSVLISSLPAALIVEVTDIINSSAGTYTCAQLKEQLLKRTSVSQKDRVRQLLTEEELGDRKPSQLLRSMRNLLGTTMIDEGFMKELFLSRLPHDTQVVLASSKERNSVEHLAELADNIAAICSKNTTVAGVSSVQPDTGDTAASTARQQSIAIQSLMHKVAQLQLQF